MMRHAVGFIRERALASMRWWVSFVNGTWMERKRLVEEALREAGIDDVPVITYSGLLVECAKSLGVEAIVRGLRATSDFDYEFQLALTNRDLDSEVETVFLMTAGKYSFLSSSIVKEVARYGGDVSKFVPKCVERALREKYRR